MRPNLPWHIDGYDNYLVFVSMEPSMDLAVEFDGLTLDTQIMILLLFIITWLTVCGNMEKLQVLLELIVELRMGIL